MTPKKKDYKKVKKAAQQTHALQPLGENIPLSLQWIAEKRIGGAVNLRGIYFQLLFTLYIVLDRLKKPTGKCHIRMEGVEDVDVYVENESHLYQVKTADMGLDANTVWNKKVLQHFWEADQVAPGLLFYLVHNSKITKGKLEGFGTDNLPEETVKHWHKKFTEDNIQMSVEDLKAFLSRITIKSMEEQDLHQLIVYHLVETFGINAGTEPAFLNALFYWVLEAAKKKTVVVYQDLVDRIESVKDTYAKFPLNPAIQNNWIAKVSYEISREDTDLGYYEGKAARPVDIARALPVRREKWEKAVRDKMVRFDTIVIKSSSGQGKSTIVWQVGFELKQLHFSVYRLLYCKEYNEVAAINDFIESRLRAGEMPVIIIDGLGQQQAAWAELAKMLRDKPVKLLVTAREEDWVRYGDDISAILIDKIDIFLSREEAKLIYIEMAKNKKLHGDVSTWEPFWEQVSARGLMIEYIFLLTHGQIMEERLRGQVNKLRTEEGSAAKLEVLRMIALADVLGIKLATNRLTQYIREQVGFVTDRNEAYRQLEKEYYIRFSYEYVEGLHPVRSGQLMEILHSHIPVSESLINLLSIVDENYTYDYFINAPLMLEVEKKTVFAKQAAETMAARPVPEMVYAMDGLMHLEPYRFWLENQSIFDIVSQRGGLELFIYDTAPFSKLNTLNQLSDGLAGSGYDNIKFLNEKLQELKPYSIDTSLIFQFASFLKQELAKKLFTGGFEGLTFLRKWFHLLNIDFPDIIKIEEDELLRLLETKEIGETSDIFHLYSILRPEAYRTFINTHKELVIGWIKKKTNTVTIREEENEMHIHYLLEKDSQKANEFSVHRINIVHSFFPWYGYYCTRAIILPFPNAEFHRIVLQNSIKRIPADNMLLGNNFEVHLKQIWSKTILHQYSAGSFYEWQKQYKDFRILCLHLYKECTRLLEATLEENERQRNSVIKKLVAMQNAFFEKRLSMKKLPAGGKKYFEKPEHGDQIRMIEKWNSSFNNFVSQLPRLLNSGNDNNRRLPLINIRAAEFQLKDMQTAYNEIVERSYLYSEIEQLCIDEQKWLKRLFHTVQFFVAIKENYNDQPRIVAAAREIEKWKLAEQQQRLEQLQLIVADYTAETGYIFFVPSEILEDDALNHAVIGMQEPKLTSFDDKWWNVSIGLSRLFFLDIDFYSFVIVNDKQEATGAFKVGREYFEQFQRLANGLELDDKEALKTLPVVPNENLLRTLKGITIKKAISIAADDSFFLMMINLWKLIVYRENLNPNNTPERIWLEQIEGEFGEAIRNEMSIAITSEPSAVISKALVFQIINKEINYSTEEICDCMMKKAIEMHAAVQA